MDLNDFPRIAVIGCPGSGKSTLSRQIAEKSGHPLIHLDYEHWQPGWVSPPKDEWRAMQEQWVQGERWIIDGNYNGTIELRFAAADLVIFLDLPRLLCLWRVMRRHGQRRPDLRPDVVESSIFSKEFLEFLGFIWKFKRERVPKIPRCTRNTPGWSSCISNRKKCAIIY